MPDLISPNEEWPSLCKRPHCTKSAWRSSGNNNSGLIEKSILSFIFRSRTIYLALRSLREIGFISSQEKAGMKLGNKMKSQPSSAKTLADMLKELNNNNLIKREVFNEIPPIVDFTLIKGL